MLIGEFKLKRDALIEKAIDTLEEQTGWDRFLAKNVILWRKARGLSLYARKVLPEAGVNGSSYGVAR